MTRRYKRVCRTISIQTGRGSKQLSYFSYSTSTKVQFSFDYKSDVDLCCVVQDYEEGKYRIKLNAEMSTVISRSSAQ